VVLLVVIFVGVIPQFADYSATWAHMTDLGIWWWVAIAVAAIFGQISGVWPYQAALPGLRFGHGFLQLETATAISSTVPGGGAVAVGMTYKMLSSFGFTDVAISAAVVTTGIWNLAGKLGLPIAAVALLAATAHPTGEIVGAAAVGAVVMVVAGVVLWLVFRTAASAHVLGHLADRVVNWALRFFDKPPTSRIERSLVHFESQTVDTVKRRGWLLTWTTLASQVAAFVLLLVIVRAVGISSREVTFLAVLTSFAVARLAGAVPVTPGGLGTVDAALIAMLTAFGASASEALAADLIWRLTTYFLPIFPGIVSYVIWLRRQGRSSAPATAAPPHDQSRAESPVEA
jgi:hypothetical protein